MSERLLGVWRGGRSLLQWNIKFTPPPVNLEGKTAVVTGGSAGMGREEAKYLASRGADVYIGCRNVRRALELREEVQAQAASGTSPGRIECLYLDLSDLDSVREFAKQLKERTDLIDIFLANAGIAGEPYQLSKQGHERHFAVNHLGHFLLISELLDRLIPARARVVVVGSQLHQLVSDATPDYGPYRTGLIGGWLAYSRSKLAKAWFAYELQRRAPELIVPYVHPGIVNTGIVKTSTPVIDQLLALLKPLLLISPAKGARTPLFCAVAPGVRGGTYYHNTLGVLRTSKESLDQDRAARFWEQCERLCREQRAAAVGVPR